MQELIKAQYRNQDMKDDAYEKAFNILKSFPAQSLLKSNGLLTAFCNTIALSIISDTAKRMQKNAGGTLAKRGREAENAEVVIRDMAGLFLDEMESAADVAGIDIGLWLNKSRMMGAGDERLTATITSAWTEKNPPLFSDFYARVRQAIDGYINSVFQMLVISNAD